jgi:curved DNA-binding protein CbpA
VTLYETLGVDRSADDAAIRAAFRRASKRAHPDGGGSPEAFAKIARAKSVLLDPKRRRTYDTTGEIEEPPPDNDMAQAVAMLMQMVFQIIDMVGQQGGCLDQFDVVKATREQLVIQRDQATNQEQSMRLDAARVRRIALKFRTKTKKAVNQIRRSVEARADEIERAAAQQTERVRITTMAIGILDEHEFDYQASPQMVANWMFTGGAFS